MLLGRGTAPYRFTFSWPGVAQTDAYTSPKTCNTLSMDHFNARSAAEPFEADFPSFWVVFRLYLLCYLMEFDFENGYLLVLTFLIIHEQLDDQIQRENSLANLWTPLVTPHQSHDHTPPNRPGCLLHEEDRKT